MGYDAGIYSGSGVGIPVGVDTLKPQIFGAAVGVGFAAHDTKGHLF